MSQHSTDESEWPVVRLPQPLGLYAGDLLRRSQEFGAAFGTLDVRPDSGLHYPAYYLLSHATELALKAFLAARGTDKSSLKKLDHNLKRIANRALQANLPVVDMFDLMIERLNNLNKEHSLRYPAWRFFDFPMPSECSTVLSSLQEAIRPTVDNAATRGRFEAWKQHPPPAQYVWID